MTIKPRTVADLGIEANVRYANDMKILDQKLIQESQLVSQKTETAAISPYAASEFDQLFSLASSLLWANFVPPPGYFTLMQRAFSYQIIPSLGSYEQQDADIEKLTALKDSLSKDDEEKEQQRDTLLEFMQLLVKLDKTLSLINSRRNQYQRG